MKSVYIILLGLIFAKCGEEIPSQPEYKVLFLIRENNKYGYMDSLGKVVIKPQFIEAYDFSEGLALARTTGAYGYINQTGKFAIKQQFDYATAFSDGFAIAYEGTKSFFINKKGEKAFKENYPQIEPFEDGKARIKTMTGKYGMIDTTGKIVIDTIFTHLGPFEDGMATVICPNVQSNSKEGCFAGVINERGKFIVPTGKFNWIRDYKNGHFIATIPAESWDTLDGQTARTAIIDRRGKIIVSKKLSYFSNFDGNFNCGLVKVRLTKNWFKGIPSTITTSSPYYYGFMNKNGKIAIDDTTFSEVTNFADNRAFVTDEPWSFSVINTDGKYIAKKRFSDVLNNGFVNGLAFVEVSSKWGLIDTNVHFTIKPTFDAIHEIGIIEDYFFFGERNPKNWNELFYGIATIDGTIMVNATLNDFDKSGFKHGLLQCTIDKKLTYINKKGNIIWQEKQSQTIESNEVNLVTMNPGAFLAYSLPSPSNRSNGWYESDNIPRKMNDSITFEKNALSIIVNTKIVNGQKQHEVYVGNTLSSICSFNAQDSRLNMKVQAKDKQGIWRDIEYLPASWCGNSYHILTLEPNYFWTFSTPNYVGDFKTKLRIALESLAKKSKYSSTIEHNYLYSNEYDGSINLGQFWRKEDTKSFNLMVPY